MPEASKWILIALKPPLSKPSSDLEVGTGSLYSPRCHKGFFSETGLPVFGFLKTRLPTPRYRIGMRVYARGLDQRAS